jgi:hydrogenase/urease accessory protein HupE
VNQALLLGITVCWTLLTGGTVKADESQPLYIEIIELQTAHYQLRWRMPASIPAQNRPHITLPTSCNRANTRAQTRTLSLIGQALYVCRANLAGENISLHYPQHNPAVSSLIKYRSLSGEQHTRLLSPAERAWQIPLTETASTVAKDYTLLGIKHILAGIDHLLFIICLLYIAGSGRRILVTITGFTLAHSVTLALSTLKLVQLPLAPVEASIALSIVFLATEIAKNRRESLTWRSPIAVSSAFGLLHGFGFAAALNDIGLPQTELFTGLLFFNIGVEIGQLVFATTVIALFLFSRLALQRCAGETTPSRQALASRTKTMVSYTVGSLASFWLIARCMTFVPG